MNLRLQAAADVRRILEDTSNGFGWEITIIAPSGESKDLTGFSADIALAIDPDTGVVVSGRQASVALPLAAVKDAGLGVPRAIADTGQKPWLIKFKDLSDTDVVFVVTRTAPDATVDSLLCFLEAYKQ